jgi:hypothetical protein
MEFPAISSSVQLPRNLARPPFTEVSRDSIIAAAPELASVAVEDIRAELRSKASQYVHFPSPFLIVLIYDRQRQLGCLQASHA